MTLTSPDNYIKDYLDRIVNKSPPVCSSHDPSRNQSFPCWCDKLDIRKKFLEFQKLPPELVDMVLSNCWQKNPEKRTLKLEHIIGVFTKLAASELRKEEAQQPKSVEQKQANAIVTAPGTGMYSQAVAVDSQLGWTQTAEAFTVASAQVRELLQSGKPITPDLAIAVKQILTAGKQDSPELMALIEQRVQKTTQLTHSGP